MAGREGVAAAAVVLRWGSYLAVLLDRDKPVWTEVQSASTSRIHDQEMARINIEASAALAEWIDLYRADSSGRLYDQLVNRAISYLAMPKKTSKLLGAKFASLADPAMAEQVVQSSEPARLQRIRADCERFPSRIFANALVNTAWRNGPAETIHSGAFRGHPLDQRRITPAEERNLMAYASERLALGMSVCLCLSLERPRRSWPEQVLPYGLAKMWLITSMWSLPESSREVRLQGTA
jgi:site-specific DNA-cytosine methylase